MSNIDNIIGAILLGLVVIVGRYSQARLLDEIRQLQRRLDAAEGQIMVLRSQSDSLHDRVDATLDLVARTAALVAK